MTPIVKWKSGLLKSNFRTWSIMIFDIKSFNCGIQTSNQNYVYQNNYFKVSIITNIWKSTSALGNIFMFINMLSILMKPLMIWAQQHMKTLKETYFEQHHKIMLKLHDYNVSVLAHAIHASYTYQYEYVSIRLIWRLMPYVVGF